MLQNVIALVTCNQYQPLAIGIRLAAASFEKMFYDVLVFLPLTESSFSTDMLTSVELAAIELEATRLLV